jgi:hypothetical protein
MEEREFARARARSRKVPENFLTEGNEGNEEKRILDVRNFDAGASEFHNEEPKTSEQVHQSFVLR